MPIPLMYKARNTEEIVRHFTNRISTASFENTVMAKPVGDEYNNAPPFCLLVFGSDGKYGAEDVSNRWKFISNQLKQLNITDITFSSDGDPKYNSAMRKNSLLGCESREFNGIHWFKCGDGLKFPFYTQDSIHIGTKWRNRFLKTINDPHMLPFGKKFFVQIAHIQQLLDHPDITKDKHQITPTTLDPNDRQNFDSVTRICSPEVSALLEKYVENSSGTIKFLELLRNFLEAYRNQSLEPLERVSKFWYSMFVVRLWKQFILKSKNYTLKNNFLTSNCFSCLEQNAHSLILIIRYLKTTNQPHLSKPWLFSSQACEGFYRQIRSFSTCYSTVTNCTVKEILERIHKIQLQCDISDDTSTNFIFPNRLKTCNSFKTSDFVLPTDAEIFEVIEKSKLQAIEDAIKFGFVSNRRNINLNCNIPPHGTIFKKSKESDEEEYDSDEAIEASMLVLSQLRKVNLPNYAEKFHDIEIDESSSYPEVFGGRRIVLKKSSLCWLLRKNETKLSSDRIQRVKNGFNIKKTRKRSIKKNKFKKKIL